MVTGGSLKGRLLIALPILRDPNFDRTIVLLLHHDEEGAVGVILNRPSRMDVSDALPQWKERIASPAVFFLGGPIGPSAAICLAQLRRGGRPGADGEDEGEVDGWQPVLERVGTFDLTQDPAEVGDVVEELRVFSGYAGWRGGQLEEELEAGAWLVVEPEVEDPLSPDPENLWRTVLRRQKGNVALLAAFPEDPSLN